MTSEPQNIRENQNGETSDTAHSDRRKHDYKPNRENKKSDDNDNKKKRNRNKITYQLAQIIKTFTSWVIVESNTWKDGN